MSSPVEWLIIEDRASSSYDVENERHIDMCRVFCGPCALQLAHNFYLANKVHGDTCDVLPDDFED